MDIISTSENGKLSFGNYTLTEKQKKEDFPHCGDLYKIKTYNTMTKLEKNGLFLFESVPGTDVTDFEENESYSTYAGGSKNTDYDIEIDGKSIGKIKSNTSGKVSFSVELTAGDKKDVKIIK